MAERPEAVSIISHKIYYDLSSTLQTSIVLMKRHFPFQSLSLYKYAILLALSIILLQNMEVGLSA